MATFFEFVTWVCLAVCGYVYVGYAALICGLARFKRVAAPALDDLPSVSILIAAYNEQDVIGGKIANSFALDYPLERLEVLVVTDGSNDDTVRIVEDWAARSAGRLQPLHAPERRGKSAAINRAMAHAKGEIVIFSDANAFYAPDALRNLVRHFADSRVGCVGGRKTVRANGTATASSEGAYWRYESCIKAAESRLGTTTTAVGEMNAVRRTLLALIPPHIINDDAYLALSVLRAGYRVIYEPAALCWETSSASTRDEVTRRQRINAGRYQFLLNPRLWPRRNPLAMFEFVSHKLLRALLPLFMILALAANLLAVMSGPGQGLMAHLLAAQLAFYGLAALGLALERVGRVVRLPALAAYVLSSNFAALCGLVGYVRGTQTVLWKKAARGRMAGP